jgi:hypothetical protein
MKLKDLAIAHPYYSSENNFYSNDASENYKTWTDFYEEYHDEDIDRNLIFRWDITKKEDCGIYCMKVFIINQRIGIYRPISIDHLDDKDAPQIREFLKQHLDRLIEMWKPIK